MNIFVLILLFILISILVIMYRLEIRNILPSIKHISLNNMKNSHKQLIAILFILNFGLIFLSIAGTGYELSEDLIYYQEAEVFHSSLLLIYNNPILPSSSIILIVKGHYNYSWYDPVEIEAGVIPFASIKTLDQIFRDGQRVRFSGRSTGTFTTIGYGELIQKIKLTYISAIDKPHLYDWLLLFSLIVIPVNLGFAILRTEIHIKFYRYFIE